MNEFQTPQTPSPQRSIPPQSFRGDSRQSISPLDRTDLNDSTKIVNPQSSAPIKEPQTIPTQQQRRRPPITPPPPSCCSYNAIAGCIISTK